MNAPRERTLLAEGVADGAAPHGIRSWAQRLLEREWSRESVACAMVVLEELACHACQENHSAPVRLSFRSGNCLRIEVDDEAGACTALGTELGALLVRNLSVDSGLSPSRGCVTLWAHVNLETAHVPKALSARGALIEADFGGDEAVSRN